MPFELFPPVKKITVGSKFTTYKSISQCFRDIDHFGVEIPDPLHLIMGIAGLGLDHFGGFGNNVGIHPFCLEFRDDGEYQSREMMTGSPELQPEELQLLQKPEPAVKMLKVLIQIGNIDKKGDGFFPMI